MASKKILYVTSECKNFAVTGGLAEVAGSLPKAIMNANKNYKVKVIMPLYKTIINNYSNKLKFVGYKYLDLAWRSVYCGLFTLKYEGVDYYFVDNKQYFDRDNLYGYFDDGERFAFFSKSIFTALEIMDFHPDIIHANDWHSALVNIYLDILYKKRGYMMEVKSVFTIHNIEYQGIYEKDFLEDIIGIDNSYMDILEYRGLINLMKGAIVCSDLVNTVSPRYAREISTTAYACGLEYIIRQNNQKIFGIINGIDVDYYNPQTDTDIFANYDVETLDNKADNKEAIQKMLNLTVDKDICLISVISRLAGHKGIDLIVEKMDELMKENVQIIVLGKGDKFFENKFIDFARKYPGRVSSLIIFDIALSKKIYAASDLFLMPSKMEPCGLSQMIASRYGAIPIVRATGGLFDSIKDYYEEGLKNGFVFKEYSGYEMLDKVKSAINVYYNKDEYIELQKRVMKIDFSWNVSAKSYISLYAGLLKKK